MAGVGDHHGCLSVDHQPVEGGSISNVTWPLGSNSYYHVQDISRNPCQPMRLENGNQHESFLEGLGILRSGFTSLFGLTGWARKHGGQRRLGYKMLALPDGSDLNAKRSEVLLSIFFRISRATSFPSYYLESLKDQKLNSHLAPAFINMHTNTVLASFIALAKLVSSAPADATSIAPPASTSTSTSTAGCIVPLVIFSTIDKPFILSALTLDSIPWPVQLDPPSKTVETSPFISRTKIAQPLFRLTGGNLTTIGRGNAIDNETTRQNAFPAYFGPKIQIFPPVPDPLFFGAFGDAYSGFSAGYSCDKDGKIYLELRAGRCF